MYKSSHSIATVWCRLWTAMEAVSLNSFTSFTWPRFAVGQKCQWWVLDEPTGSYFAALFFFFLKRVNGSVLLNRVTAEMYSNSSENKLSTVQSNRIQSECVTLKKLLVKQCLRVLWFFIPTENWLQQLSPKPCKDWKPVCWDRLHLCASVYLIHG